MRKQTKFTFLSSKSLSFTQKKISSFVFIEAVQSQISNPQIVFSSNYNILLPESVYTRNRQLVVEVGAGGTKGAVQHGFRCSDISRAADNCKLFKIRFKSIIKHPV